MFNFFKKKPVVIKYGNEDITVLLTIDWSDYYAKIEGIKTYYADVTIGGRTGKAWFSSNPGNILTWVFPYEDSNTGDEIYIVFCIADIEEAEVKMQQNNHTTGESEEFSLYLKPST